MKKLAMHVVQHFIPWRLVLIFLCLSLLVWITIPLNLHRSFSLFVQQIVPKSWDSTLFVFSLIGSIEVTSLVVMLCIFLIKSPYAKLAIVGLFILGLSIEVLGKTVIPLKGPDRPFWRSHSYTLIVRNLPHFKYSFPSGHMYRSVYCVILLMYLSRPFLQRNIRNVIACMLLIGMAGSRVSLGEHWISDVVGGWLLAVIMGSIATKTMKYYES